ncbi:MAG: pyridoxal-phosphate dependent enzyme [Pseudomonadota bacterium]
MTENFLTSLTCSGCGHIMPTEERYPFRCPKQADGDDIDHVLRETISSAAVGMSGLVDSEESNPFLKYRKLFHVYQAARGWGLKDADYVALVRELNGAVKSVDGKGFEETPFEPESQLAEALHLERKSGLFVKDETGNVSGSHKARHLMGIMIWLQAVRRAFPKESEGVAPILAIASCGNAALAAAVVAKAAGRALDVFVPPSANPNVVRRLQALGARLVTCPRDTAVSGDPCYLRFKEAIRGGARPFTVQGNENGLTISGGKTLAYEMAFRLRREGRSLDRILVHVGGGALASAIIQGLHDMHVLGFLERLPRIHTVQTEGAYPLARAYKNLSDRILLRYPTKAEGNEKRSSFILSDVPKHIVTEELRFAATHRSSFMWPWEKEPRSIAHGILDDETYDWFAVVEGMLRTGGFPLVVSEKQLQKANELSREHTKVRADHTGTAGLAGLLELQRTVRLRSDETVAVLFTGAER